MKAPRFAAIVLAAGLSTRMPSFKPLLPLGGKNVIEHALATFQETGVDVYLVVGHRQQEVRDAVSRQAVTVVPNPDYEKGMLSSVQAGVRNLPPEYAAFFLLPADIPLISPSTITALREAGRENPGKVIYPVYHGKRGHPPLVPANLIPEILAWESDGGLQAVLHRHTAIAYEVPVNDEFTLRDIDTQEAYQNLVTWLESHPDEKK